MDARDRAPDSPEGTLLLKWDLPEGSAWQVVPELPCKISRRALFGLLFGDRDALRPGQEKAGAKLVWEMIREYPTHPIHQAFVNKQIKGFGAQHPIGPYRLREWDDFATGEHIQSLGLDLLRWKLMWHLCSNPECVNRERPALFAYRVTIEEEPHARNQRRGTTGPAASED